MGWFTGSSSSSPRRPSRPGYASSTYSSSSRHHASTSRYKRSPRDGYIQYLYAKLRELFHRLWSYVRRHPFRMFFMVVMPLISGGILHRFAKQFGVDLPDMGGRGGGPGGRAGDGGYYGSEGYGRAGSGGVDIASVANGIGGLATIAKTAQMFM